MTARRRLGTVGFHALAVGVALLFVGPGLWVVAASLRQPGSPPPAGIEWLPAPAAWANYARIFELLPLARYLGTSLLALLAPVTMGSSPFFVLIFYWAFRRLPPALFEAARLEGMGALRIWAHVAMPLARPATAAVALLTFVQYWSDFMNPLLYLKSDDRYTLALGLRVLQQMDAANWPLLMAGAVVMMLPVLLVLGQRALWSTAERAPAPKLGAA